MDRIGLNGAVSENLNPEKPQLHGPEDFNSLVMFLCVMVFMVVGLAWVAVKTKTEKIKMKRR